MWLDNPTTERITHALEPEAVKLVEEASRHAEHTVDTSVSLECPVCRSDLQRRQVAHARVEIDNCSAHGTWFDRDELLKVARSLAALRAYGGASRADVAHALAGGAALATGTALGAGALQNPSLIEPSRQDTLVERAEVAIDVADAGASVVETGITLVDAAGSAGDVADAASGLFEIVGGIFEALG